MAMAQRCHLHLSDGDQRSVEAAVAGTMLALTPTVTPIPTAVPVLDTFTVSNPVHGDIEAPVKIVEFTSYTCPYCGYFRRETLPELQAHYGELVVFISRDFPRSEAEVMLNIANRCANEQNKFWEFSNQFWQNQVSESPLPLGDESTIATFAEIAGINTDSFASCRDNDEIQSLVLVDRQRGVDLGVGATPTFFVNGVRVVGAKPIEFFMDIIDAELRANGITPPALS